MLELNQKEKELILVSLGNSLVDLEQSDTHKYIIDLYEKLRLSWMTGPASYHSAQEIIAIRESEGR